MIWLITFWWPDGDADERKSYKSRLPRPKDFPGALYVFDIGQNDLAAGFRNLSYQHLERLNETIPDIVDQFAAAVQVRSLKGVSLVLHYNWSLLKALAIGFLLCLCLLLHSIYTNKVQGHSGFITQVRLDAWQSHTGGSMTQCPVTWISWAVWRTRTRWLWSSTGS